MNNKNNIKNIFILFFLSFFIFLLFLIVNNNIKNRLNILIDTFSNNEIPKIIIQTWKTKSIPDKYKKDVKSIREYNKDYKFLFFDDDDINDFLKNNYPEYYISYNKLPVKIQKIDYFRYIAIYHYGGFYFDLDMRGLYPLDELLKYDCVFPVDQNINATKCDKSRYIHYCKRNMKILLGQYAFGAKPRNEFIKLLIDNIHNNIDKYNEEYNKSINKSTNKLQYVYSSTGPDYVTDIYMDYKNKDNINILYYDDAQFFGKYAKHNHYGTWK
jgi:mannosyltransferase OCH1-like enzyme